MLPTDKPEKEPRCALTFSIEQTERKGGEGLQQQGVEGLSENSHLRNSTTMVLGNSGKSSREMGIKKCLYKIKKAGRITELLSSLGEGKKETGGVWPANGVSQILSDCSGKFSRALMLGGGEYPGRGGGGGGGGWARWGGVSRKEPGVVCRGGGGGGPFSERLKKDS